MIGSSQVTVGRRSQFFTKRYIESNILTNLRTDLHFIYPMVKLRRKELNRSCSSDQSYLLPLPSRSVMNQYIVSFVWYAVIGSYVWERLVGLHVMHHSWAVAVLTKIGDIFVPIVYFAFSAEVWSHRVGSREFSIVRVLAVLSVSCGLLSNFVAVSLTFVQPILKLKLSLYTIVHLLLDELKNFIHIILRYPTVISHRSPRFGVVVWY